MFRHTIRRLLPVAIMVLAPSLTIAGEAFCVKSRTLSAPTRLARPGSQNATGPSSLGGDACSLATDITPLLVCGTGWQMDEPMGIATATPSGDPAGSCWTFDPFVQNDIWYRWTNTTGADAEFQASTDDLANCADPLTDTQLAIYDSCVGFNELACDEDGGTTCVFTSLTDPITVANTETVYIQFDGFNGDTRFDRALFRCTSLAPPGPGDTCGNPIPLGSLSTSLTGPVIDRDAEPIPTGPSDYNEIEPSFGIVLDQAETCYTFTASEDGYIQIAAEPTDNNGRVIISEDLGATWNVSPQCWSNTGGGYDTSPQHGQRVSAGQDYCFCIDSGVVSLVKPGDLWDMEMFYWPLTTQTNLDCATSQELRFCASPVEIFTNLSTAGAGHTPAIPPGSGCGPGFWDICSGDGEDLSYHLEWTQAMVNCGCDGFRITQTAPLLSLDAEVCDASIQIGTTCPPTTTSCIATMDDQLSGNTESVEVTGLGAGQVGTTYFIEVDQFMASACPEFDLTAELLNCATPCTTPLCPATPDIVVESCPEVDDCDGTGDGDIDPGDTLTYTITFRNLGAGVATNFTADIDLRGVSLVSGGTVGPVATLAAGASHDHTLVVEVLASCGGKIEVNVINMTSTEQPFADDTSSCRDRVEPPGPDCVVCCSAGQPTGVIGNRLLATKDVTGVPIEDVLLSWVGATVSPPDYSVWTTSDETKLREADSDLGSQTNLGSTMLETLTDVAAVPGSANELRFYKVVPAACGVAVFPCDVGPCLR